MRRIVSSRLTRYRIWSQLRAAADAEGIDRSAFGRVAEYLDGHCKVRKPRYTCADQQPWNYFPGLTAKPLHDAADFPWCAELEARFDLIRDEVLRARDGSNLKPHHQRLVEHGRWDTLYFHAAGRRIEETFELCPRTGALVDALPTAGSAGQAYFSVLSGHAHIKPHFGPTNVRLRCHFGIVVPDGCRIRVGSQVVHWEAGRCLFFDDSFEHEVWNTSADDRIVLIIDCWHPELTAAERWAVEWITAASAPIRKYQQSVAGA